MNVLIDTSVLISVERRGGNWENLAALAPGAPALASITASEMLAGTHRAETPQRRARREAFVEPILAHLPIFPFDLDVARVHARLWAQLATSGQMVEANDLLIGATAVANNYAVLTQNRRDFERIPGLQVVEPPAA